MRWFGRRRKKFVSRAPRKGGGEVELRVSRMTIPHVVWWQANVQPIIDRDETRVDNGWNWALYVPFTMVAGTMLVQQPNAYTVGLVDHEQDAFTPVAMVLMAGRYPALDNHRKSSVFVWFLTTAPDEALLGLKEHPVAEDDLPKRLGTIALDVAVTHSLNHRRKGRTGLHADEEGGDGLLAWYQRRGMEVLPEDDRLPPGIRRLVNPNDGRYCYYTIPGARDASQGLDPLR